MKLLYKPFGIIAALIAARIGTTCSRRCGRRSTTAAAGADAPRRELAEGGRRGALEARRWPAWAPADRAAARGFTTCRASGRAKRKPASG